MGFLRNLVRDLVERRLWPVAVVLLVALVAVPVVLGRGGGGEEPAVALAPGGGAATGAAVPGARDAVGLDPAAPASRRRSGAVRNPFGRADAPAQRPDPEPSPDSSGPSPGGATAPSDPKPPGDGEAPEKPGAGDPQNTYKVTLSFGEPGRPRAFHDVARLTPLPSVTDPFFVFLGVLEDGRTAAFLIASDATATGDGTCRPSAERCETIELKGGDTEFFDLTDPDGTIKQYQLDVEAIERVKATSPAAASAAHLRRSQVGAELLRDVAVRGDTAAPGARAYRFVAERGVLVRAKGATGTDVRVVAGGRWTPAPAAQQPGLPVWRSVPGR